MPVFIEDPTEFTKEQLRLALISHNVELPSEESRKEVYVDLYLKHVGNKYSADFSSDDEEQAQNGTEVGEKEEEENMVDLGTLTDDQLKKQLLRYGVKAGPIVGSTRGLYERKLQRLMAHPSQSRVNGTKHAAKYSDSEEDEGEDEDEKEDDEEEEKEDDDDDEEEESESKQLGPESVYHNKTSATARTEPAADILMDLFPDTATTPTGITATKRRSIKGAAGRPVKFKYTETPLSPASLERREIQQHLLPLWVQILVFLLVAVLLSFIYICMEDGLENPFSGMLDSLSEELIPDELALIPSSQDLSTSETAA